MPNAAWKVEYQDAYRVWLLRFEPSLDDEADVDGTLLGWEAGPPNAKAVPLVDNHAVRRRAGTPIIYRVLRLPPSPSRGFVGHIFVVRIG